MRMHQHWAKGGAALVLPQRPEHLQWREEALQRRATAALEAVLRPAGYWVMVVGTCS